MDMTLWTLTIFRAVASKICSAAPDSATSFVACGSMSTVSETLKLDKWHLVWMYSVHTRALYVQCTHTRAVCTVFLHVNSDKHDEDANVWDCIKQSWKSGKAEITGNDRNKPKFACTKQLRADWIQGRPAAMLPAHFVFQFAILRPNSLTQPHA